MIMISWKWRTKLWNNNWTR